MLREAKTLVSIGKFEKIDLNKDNFPYPKHFFDIVVAFDVLEHIENTDRVLKNVIRVLNPGGIFYVITPNGFQPADKDVTHINIKTFSEWLNYISNNGFKVLDSFTYIWYPPSPYNFLNIVKHCYYRLRGYGINQVVRIFSKI